MVESYRNSKELVNLQCWALTCQSFFSRSEWLWLFKHLDIKVILNLSTLSKKLQ